MSNNKRNDIFAGKGYYISLLLCAAAIGLAGFLYYSNRDAEQVSMEQPQAEATVFAEPQAQDVPVLATEPAPSYPAPSSESATAPTEKRSLKTTAPVSGEAVYGYSMETLSYNQTTRDWRVHNGVDIAAEAGTEVVAAADGEVYTTYEDELLGYTVVIRHEGGYTTKYACLAEELSVNPGDTVSMGDVIGTVGETALVESVLGPHVHFSVTYQNEPMDPGEFLSLS